jgi:OOP family OmpA-OmpF porin
MKKIQLVAILVFASFAAHAEGVYVGADLIYNRYNFNVSGVTGGGNSGGEFSGKALIGYKFNDIWAVEGGYADLGSPSYNYSIGTTTGSLKSSSNAWYAAAKGTVPLNEQFSVYGKLGLARTHFSVDGSGIGSTLGQSDNKTALYAGIGAQYNLTKNVGWTLELERFGSNSDRGSKGNTISTGIRYSF